MKLIIAEIADVDILETPTPLKLASVSNGDTPPPPKKCRRLKWMVPYLREDHRINAIHISI